MLAKLLILFTLVPLIEVWLLVQIGGYIGALPTIFLVAVTGFVGVLLAKSQGIMVLTRLQRKLAVGSLPTGELYNGACILVGGALLLTPGVLTDMFGLSLLFPITREVWKAVFARMIKKMIKKGTINVYHSNMDGYKNAQNDPDNKGEYDYCEPDFEVFEDEEDRY